MSYFMGKEGFIWWQGVVEDRHDPLYLGRCKVRILGWHSELKTDQPTKTLPWAYPVSPITSASQTGVGTTPLGPVEGTWVLGFYRDGESGQEPMFFGTFGGIPELDGKFNNLEKGFSDPRQPGGDPGHPLYPDEIPTRQLRFDAASIKAGQSVPREPASIIHNAAPNPTQHPQEIKISESVTLKQGAKPTTHEAHVKGEYSSFPVTQLIKSRWNRPAYTVKLVENPVRSTFPDTGLSPLDKTIPTSLISNTRNLNYLKEPTTNRLARGIRGNTLKTDPSISGIVYEKTLAREQGQTNISCATGSTWSEPHPAWNALYPYNHVHQTESGHIIEMDDTPGHERLHWYHRAGTFTEIDAIGIKHEKTVNDHYSIILGSKYSHIEGGDCLTVDGSQQVLVLGRKNDRIGSSYLISMGKGSFELNNPGNLVSINSYDYTVSATHKITHASSHFYRHSGHAHHNTSGEQTDSVGGKWTMGAKAFSLNTVGSASVNAGMSWSVKASDSINESIFGLLPSATMGYAKKTTATLGKIGMESIDSLATGGIEFLLGPAGIGASFSMKPLGDVKLDALNEIVLLAGLGSLKGTSLLGDVAFDSLLSSSKLTSIGEASMQGLLGEVSISSAGKVKVKGLIITMKQFMDDIIDIITEHTHPSGAGPTGPPMPPASVKLSLLKSIKVGQSFE